ncbi:prepilin peptidase [Candidatus Desantisbacteria bacterium]|nr:prepilin peptidase [Candidatus Desantisbacteria bacterium]
MIIYFLIFIFGMVIGSFLNVCIYRLPKDESIIMPVSHCPKCNNHIKPYDNIPVISYFILHGKCRACGTKISPQYPLVEILTGVLFLSLYYYNSLSLDFVLNSILISGLIISAFIDIDYKIIPDSITLPLIIFFITISFGRYLISNNLNFVIDSFLGMLLGGGFLFLIAIIWRGGMGGGDIKLAALIGSAIGWKMVILVLFLSFIIGAVSGIILILSGKKTRKDVIPFGPFLCLGAFISIFWGKIIIYWYCQK